MLAIQQYETFSNRPVTTFEVFLRGAENESKRIGMGTRERETDSDFAFSDVVKGGANFEKMHNNRDGQTSRGNYQN